MASAKDPRLTKLKRKGKPSAYRTVKLGNPDIVQVPLKIEKATGRVKNLDELKTIVAGAELSELRDLYESLTGKKTKARKAGPLAASINAHLDAVAEGYLEAAGEKSEPPEALAEAAGMEEKHEVVDAHHGSDKPCDDEGGSWDWVYKGATYTLTCTGHKQYPLAGPEGHPACNKIYTSPGKAAQAITGSSAEINGRARFGMKKSKRARPGQGGTSRRNVHRQSFIRPRDPRLPLVGDEFIKVHNGIEYRCTMLDGDRVRVVSDPDDLAAVATYNSISQAATDIGGASESGYRFFALNQGVDQLDPWKLIVGSFLRIGATMDEFLAMCEDDLLQTDGDDEYAQDIADQIARAFYKRQAMRKITEMLASSKPEEEAA